MPRNVVHATILLFTPDPMHVRTHAYLSHSSISYSLCISIALWLEPSGPCYSLLPSLPSSPLLPSPPSLASLSFPPPPPPPPPSSPPLPPPSLPPSLSFSLHSSLAPSLKL